MKLLGYTKDVNICSCCGKEDLKGTYVFENENDGTIVYYGSDCARKFGYNGNLTESTGRAAWQKLIQDTINSVEIEKFQACKDLIKKINDIQFMSGMIKNAESLISDLRNQIRSWENNRTMEILNRYNIPTEILRYNNIAL